MQRMRKVCLFGTSANPPTGDGGHAGIVKYLANYPSDETDSGAGLYFDEVRVLPVYRHMFDEKRGNQASYEDRLKLCHLAFDHIPNVTVSDEERQCFHWFASKNGVTTVEAKKKMSVGTADLLDMLLERDTSTKYTLALGADTFMNLTEWKWRRAKDILNILEGRIFVFGRLQTQIKDEYDPALDDMKLTERLNATSLEMRESCPNMTKHVRIIQVPGLTAVSSSLVRSSKNPEQLSCALNPNVLNFIKENKMYCFSK